MTNSQKMMKCEFLWLFRFIWKTSTLNFDPLPSQSSLPLVFNYMFTFSFQVPKLAEIDEFIASFEDKNQVKTRASPKYSYSGINFSNINSSNTNSSNTNSSNTNSTNHSNHNNTSDLQTSGSDCQNLSDSRNLSGDSGLNESGSKGGDYSDSVPNHENQINMHKPAAISNTRSCTGTDLKGFAALDKLLTDYREGEG